MKYFTGDMWKGVNSTNKAVSKKFEKRYEENGKAYSKQLDGLRKHLGERNYKFFKHFSLHDSGFISFKFSRFEGNSVKELARLPLESRKRIIEIKTLEYGKHRIIKLIYIETFSIFMDFPEKGPRKI